MSRDTAGREETQPVTKGLSLVGGCRTVGAALVEGGLVRLNAGEEGDAAWARARGWAHGAQHAPEHLRRAQRSAAEAAGWK